MLPCYVAGMKHHHGKDERARRKGPANVHFMLCFVDCAPNLGHGIPRFRERDVQPLEIRARSGIRACAIKALGYHSITLREAKAGQVETCVIATDRTFELPEAGEGFDFGSIGGASKALLLKLISAVSFEGVSPSHFLGGPHLLARAPGSRA